MTDAEIIDRLAREVMGWYIPVLSPPSLWYRDNEMKSRTVSIAGWNPLKNIEQAFECRDKALKACPGIAFMSEIDASRFGGTHAMFYNYLTGIRVGKSDGRAPTDAHAVCLAIMELLDEKERNG